MDETEEEELSSWPLTAAVAASMNFADEDETETRGVGGALALEDDEAAAEEAGLDRCFLTAPFLVVRVAFLMTWLLSSRNMRSTMFL